MAYSRTTLSTLKDRLAKRLGGQGTFWTTHELGDAINEALAVWQLMTGDFVKTETLSMSGGDVTKFNPIELYDPTGVSGTDLSAPPMSIFRLSIAGAKLTPASIEEFDTGLYGWRLTSGADVPYIWAPLGITHLFFYPIPDAAQSVLVEYYRGDKMLTTDGTYINLGDEELDKILDYAQWYLTFKSGTKEGVENSSPLKDMFLAAATLRAEKLRGSALYSKFMGFAPDKRGTEATPQKGLRA